MLCGVCSFEGIKLCKWNNQKALIEKDYFAKRGSNTYQSTHII